MKDVYLTLHLSLYERKKLPLSELIINEGLAQIIRVLIEINHASINVDQHSNYIAYCEESMLWRSCVVVDHVHLVIVLPLLIRDFVAREEVEPPGINLP